MLLKMCGLVGMAHDPSAESESGKEQRPLLCCIRLRYDETPTKVRVDDPNVDPDADKDSKESESTAVTKSSLSSLHAKVLQIECSVGMLLRTTVGSKYKYTFVTGRLPTPLFALKSTTARNTSAALMRVLDQLPEIKTIGQHSKFFFRHSCSDQAQANMAAERSLASEYSDAVPLHFLCDVHRLYRVTRASMSGVDFDVSGILSFALALGEPGSAAALRKTLNAIFAEHLVS